MAAADQLPACLILQGPVAAKEIKQAHRKGYVWQSRIRRADWPQGGPDPSVLDYVMNPKAVALDEGEDLYLRRTGYSAGTVAKHAVIVKS